MATSYTSAIPEVLGETKKHILELLRSARTLGTPLRIVDFAQVFWPKTSWSSWGSVSYLKSKTPPNNLVSIFCQAEPGSFPHHAERKVTAHAFFDEWERRSTAASSSETTTSNQLESEPDVFCGNEHIASLSKELQNDILDRPFSESEEFGRLWMGNKGHVSHLHFDAHHGLLVTLNGLKHVELYDPVTNLDVIEKEKGMNAAKENPKKGKFTNGRETWKMVCDLRPGEAVFIPVYWWHFISCETDAVAVNFWSYPDLEATKLKFECLWPFTQRLCEELIQLRLNQKRSQGSTRVSRLALLTDAEVDKILQQVLRGKTRMSTTTEELKGISCSVTETVVEMSDSIKCVAHLNGQEETEKIGETLSASKSRMHDGGVVAFGSELIPLSMNESDRIIDAEENHVKSEQIENQSTEKLTQQENHDLPGPLNELNVALEKAKTMIKELIACPPS